MPLTETGYEIPTVDELLESLDSKQKLSIKSTFDTRPESLAGNINASVAKKLHEAYEDLQAIFNAAYPDGAFGVTLDYVSRITGTERKDPTFSQVEGWVVLEDGFGLPAGSVAHVTGDPTMKYQTLTEVPVNTSGGLEAAAVQFQAVEQGSRPRAFANTLTVIDTPQPGWVQVFNIVSSSSGRDEEEDAEFRSRREEELATPGTGTAPALRADLQALEDVEVARVFSNINAETNADGIPGHAIEIVLKGSTGLLYNSTVRDQVWNQIFNSIPAGKRTFGAEAGVVTDEAGNPQNVAFTYSDPVRVYVAIHLYIDSGDYVGDEAVARAIDTWSEGLDLGQDVYAAKIVDVVMALDGVEGVDLTQVNVDAFTPPIRVDLDIPPREFATIAWTDVTVTTSEASV